jgi:sec-independent protein translocase protein TatB
MEIFNVHIFEFLLIAGLALVVFGPERLPEIGRFIGQQVARFLAWQQQSPELQMLNEVRGEFEREIAELRDELVRTRNQLDIRDDVNAIRDELRPMLDLKAGLKTDMGAAANGTTPAAQTIAPPAPQPPTTPSPEMPDVAAAAPTVETPQELTVTRANFSEPTSLFDPPAPAAPASAVEQEPAAEPGQPEDRELLQRLNELSTGLQALVSELQSRGVIGPDWQQPAPSEQETMPR